MPQPLVFVRYSKTRYARFVCICSDGYIRPMRQVVKDRLGHEIYLTDERWNHICEEHSEMRRYRRQVLETVRRGRRFQDSVRPAIYLYYQIYPNLPRGNTSIVAVVCFGLYPDGREDNFILTAYQIRQRRK